MTSRAWTIVIWCVLILNLILGYANHFDNSFHFDDSHTIENNVYIRSLKNIPEFFTDTATFSTLPTNRSYRPLVTVSLAIDYALGQGKIFYFHLSMFLSFIVQLILMYFLFCKILSFSQNKNWSRWLSFFACAWYGFHTVNAETINYISARSDSLSTLFVVLALTLYSCSEFCKKYFIYLLPAAAGVLTKEPGAMLPLLLCVYLLLFEKSFNWQRLFSTENLKTFLSVLLAILPSLLLCFGLVFIGMKIATTYSPGGHSRLLYALTQPAVLGHYFVSFFLPYNLSADTDWGLVTSLKDDRIYYGIAFIVLLVYGAWRAAAHVSTRPIAFGICWFFISLVPTSSIIPLSEVLNDHRMFFPFVGLTLSAVLFLKLLIFDWSGGILTSRAKYFLASILVVTILLGHFWGLRARNEVWHSEETLWFDVTEKSPLNARGLMNYGLTQMAQGKYAVAEKYFLKTETIWPFYPIIHINLGVLYGALGQTEKAERYFKNALRLNPRDPAPHYYYAVWLNDQQRFNEAIERVLESKAISPGNVDAYHLLINVYQQLSKPDEVEKWVAATLKLDPNDKVALRARMDAGK